MKSLRSSFYAFVGLHCGPSPRAVKAVAGWSSGGADVLDSRAGGTRGGDLSTPQSGARTPPAHGGHTWSMISMWMRVRTVRIVAQVAGGGDASGGQGQKQAPNS